MKCLGFDSLVFVASTFATFSISNTVELSGCSMTSLRPGVKFRQIGLNERIRGGGLGLPKAEDDVYPSGSIAVAECDDSIKTLFKVFRCRDGQWDRNLNMVSCGRKSTRNIRIKRAYRDCKGGSGYYHSVINNNLTNYFRHNAALCFDELEDELEERSAPLRNLKHGCISVNYGRCRCTADSSYIFNYMETFREALQNMKTWTQDFSSIEAETFEGNMYLTYTCYLD